MVLREEAHARQQDLGIRAWHVAEHTDLAGRRDAEPDRQLEQRRLARAVRADERGDRADRHLERAIAERPVRPVPLAEPFGGNCRACHATLDTLGGRSVS